MAISFPSGFKINTNEPVDTRLVLTKEEMKNISFSKIPDIYFCVCSEDKKLYIFDKNGTESEETGNFKLVDDSISYENLNDLPNIKVGDSSFEIKDDVTIAAGDNVTITPDTENKKITISADSGGDNNLQIITFTDTDTEGVLQCDYTPNQLAQLAESGKELIAYYSIYNPELHEHERFFLRAANFSSDSTEPGINFWLINGTFTYRIHGLGNVTNSYVWVTGRTYTEYTGSSGINVTGKTISIDKTVIQEKLTAGTNITIDSNNVISATGSSSSSGNVVLKKDSLPTTRDDGSALISGDLWFCTADIAETSYKTNKWYRYNGSTWDELTDNDITTLSTWKSSFTVTPSEIASSVTQVSTLKDIVGEDETEGLQAKVKTNTSAIEQHSDEIALRVTETTFNTKTNELDGKIGTNTANIATNAASISVQANQIASKVEQTTFDTKTGEIENNVSVVTQTATDLKGEVETARGDYASLDLRIGSIESKVGGGNVTLTGGDAAPTTRDPSGALVAGDLWYCTQNLPIDAETPTYKKDKWYRYNGSTWVDVTDGEVITATNNISTLTQTTSEISSAVSKHTTDIAGLTATVSTQESKIEQHSKDIAAKVSSTGGGQTDGFEWALTKDGFQLANYDNETKNIVFQVTKDSANIGTSMTIGNQNIKDLLDTAQETADNAQTTANTAKSTADTAKDTADNAKSIADSKVKTFASDSEPTSGMSAGDIWIDTNDNNSIHRYSGTAWVKYEDTHLDDTISALSDKTDGKSTVWYGDEPTDPAVNDVWYDTTNKLIYKRKSDNTWEDVTTATLASALDAAGTAKAIADKKIKTYAQNDEPSGSDIDVGDLWFDTNDGNKVYRYSESKTWEEYQDLAIAAANELAANNKISAKQTIYYLSAENSEGAYVTPTAPTDWITDTSLDTGKWTTKIPSPVAKAHYFSCEQTKFTGTSIAILTGSVVEMNVDNTIMQWCKGTDAVKIDGGAIYANSITSSQLKADEIECSNFKYGTSGTTLKDTIDGIIVTASGGNMTFKQATVPADTTARKLVTGDLWYCTANITEEVSYTAGKWYRYDSSSKTWEEITDSETRTATSWISSWSMTPTIIETKVSNTETEVEGLSGTVTDHSSTISQHSNEIALVVETSGTTPSIKAASIVAAINDEGSEVKINADHITLSGDVVMKSNLTDGTTQISGSNITTGTISAERIDADNLKVKSENITGSLTIGTQIPNDLSQYDNTIAGFQNSSQVETTITEKGYQTETGVTKIVGDVVTTGYVNALGVTAKKITVSTNETTPSVLFSADGTAATPTVQIGGFKVDDSRLYKENSGSDVYDGLGLYNGTGRQVDDNGQGVESDGHSVMIYSGSNSDPRNGKFKITKDGWLMMGGITSSTATSYFKVNPEGKLFAKDASIEGIINAKNIVVQESDSSTRRSTIGPRSISTDALIANSGEFYSSKATNFMVGSCLMFDGTETYIKSENTSTSTNYKFAAETFTGGSISEGIRTYNFKINCYKYNSSTSAYESAVSPFDTFSHAFDIKFQSSIGYTIVTVTASLTKGASSIDCTVNVNSLYQVCSSQSASDLFKVYTEYSTGEENKNLVTNRNFHAKNLKVKDISSGTTATYDLGGFVRLTQQQYQDLETKDEGTIYLIVNA